MISSKQIAFGGGVKKPYDAEIEYLESTGTQYIDTGVAINCGTDIVDCRVAVTAVKNYGTAFGVFETINGGGRYWGARRNGTQALWQSLWGAPIHALDLGSLYDIHYEYGVDKCYINETTGTPSAGVVVYTRPVYVCAMNGDRAAMYNDQRLYSFSIRRNNLLILDLIPVRKGNIGYMYDRVSGQLFGNQGTGEFVLGPDIIDYTAKDYVQDGLVAMWDYIEDKNVPLQDKILPYIADIWDARSNRSFTMCGSGDVAISNFRPIVVKSNVGTGDFGRAEYVSSGNVRVFCGRSSGTQQAIDHIPRHYTLTINNGTWVLHYDTLNGGLASVSRSTVDPTEALWELLRISDDGFKTIKFYNRALTAEEIAHNYEIDKARFGL